MGIRELLFHCISVKISMMLEPFYWDLPHLKKEKRREKIIPKLSMTKMHRIPLCFCFLVLSKRIVTKYFTIALYYFSSNRVQVFLMKQQWFGLQGQCTVTSCHILCTEKKPSFHWNIIKSHLSVILVVGSSMGSVWAKTNVGWFSEGRSGAVTKGNGSFFLDYPQVGWAGWWVKCCPGVPASRLPAKGWVAGANLWLGGNCGFGD